MPSEWKQKIDTFFLIALQIPLLFLWLKHFRKSVEEFNEIYKLFSEYSFQKHPQFPLYIFSMGGQSTKHCIYLGP